MAIGDVLEAGTLGFFWPLSEKAPDLKGEPGRGHANREKGWIALDVLDESPIWFGGFACPYGRGEAPM